MRGFENLKSPHFIMSTILNTADRNGKKSRERSRGVAVSEWGIMNSNEESATGEKRED